MDEAGGAERSRGPGVVPHDSSSAAFISSTDSPVSMAMMPSGPSTNVWFDRPLPTRHQTPGQTSVKRRSTRCDCSTAAAWTICPLGSLRLGFLWMHRAELHDDLSRFLVNLSPQIDVGVGHHRPEENART